MNHQVWSDHQAARIQQLERERQHRRAEYWAAVVFVGKRSKRR